jgi:hypothetical protein
MKRTMIASLAASLILALPSHTALAGELEYDASLYGWLSGLSGTLGVGRIGDQAVDATFSELVGYLDFTVAGTFEARTRQFIVLTDIYYVNLGAEREAEVHGQQIKIDMDYSQWIFELSGGYRVSEKFDLLLAGRYYSFDLGATASSIEGGSTGEAVKNWGDVYVGGRFHTPLGEKWRVSARGDIGVGGSDFAWFGNAVLGYRFNNLFSLGLGYRVLSLEYETGDGADYYRYDLTTDGIGLEAMFSF